MHGVHQSEIVGRQDVRPAQTKHQEDLRGPAADAFDGDELQHHVLVRMLLQAF
jgi:hypothetical protein